MTETNKTLADLPEPIRRFVLHWGNMGDLWGVNRSVSQVHALLYASERPLTAEEIADALSMARSNVSTSLRELASWQLIRRVPVLGDRRDHFQAETDLWTMVKCIAAGRKARELDPAAAALRECVADARKDPSVGTQATARLEEMLAFVERLSRWYEQMLSLPKSQVIALMKLGTGIVRLLERRSLRRRAVGE
ncbi:MAG TPA: MarR family transcriptional regulator [Steroidobacteraceae bacterium]|nr:MarR family transcriptional regulator [Steroidobacteraceae bacterium]